MAKKDKLFILRCRYRGADISLPVSLPADINEAERFSRLNSLLAARTGYEGVDFFEEDNESAWLESHDVVDLSSSLTLDFKAYGNIINCEDPLFKLVSEEDDPSNPDTGGARIFRHKRTGLHYRFGWQWILEKEGNKITLDPVFPRRVITTIWTDEPHPGEVFKCPHCFEPINADEV